MKPISETVFIYVGIMANILDVAKRAGVSKATVSRAFNQPDSLRPETLERVQAVAKELHFLPNPIARGLVTGRSGIVGLIIPDITNPYFSYIASGCSNELNHKQLSIALYNTDEQESLEYSIRSLVNQGHADGLIIMSEAASVSEVVDILPETQTPTVYIERGIRQPVSST